MARAPPMHLTSDGNADRTRVFGILKIKTIWGCLEGLWVVLGAAKREKHRVIRKTIGAVIGAVTRKENYYGKNQ